MNACWTWSLAVSAVLASGDDADGLSRLRAWEKALVQLIDLQRRLHEGGPLPSDEDLDVVAAHRIDAFTGLDAMQAVQLGIPPDRLRGWLLPGFADELRTLNQELAGRRPDASAPSGVLTLIVDLEEEMRREALRLLFRRGLPDPLAALGLAQAPEVTVAAAEQPSADEGTAAAAPGEQSASPPLLTAESLYRRGRFAEALDQYQLVDLGREAALEPQVLYRSGECLRLLGRNAEALAVFQEVARDHAGTPWAAQAEWSASLLEALAALQDASPARGGSR